MLRSVLRLAPAIVLLMLTSAPATAQKYITAGGVRFETDRLGFTLLHRILPRTTLEAIAMGSQREISGHILARQHFPVIGKRLNFYVGGGLHAGNQKDHGGYSGIDLITGVEYKVNVLPVQLSLDFKPAIHFAHEDWMTPSTGFSLRYVFVKEPGVVGGFFKRLFNRDKEDG
jgi:hypothetical protein